MIFSGISKSPRYLSKIIGQRGRKSQFLNIRNPIFFILAIYIAAIYYIYIYICSFPPHELPFGRLASLVQDLMTINSF